MLLFPPSADGSGAGLVPLVPVVTFPVWTMLAPSGPLTAITSPERAKAKPPLVLTRDNIVVCVHHQIVDRRAGDVVVDDVVGICRRRLSVDIRNIVRWRGVGLLLEFSNVPTPCWWESSSSAGRFTSSSTIESAFWCCESPRLLPLSDSPWFLLSSFSLRFSFWSLLFRRTRFVASVVIFRTGIAVILVAGVSFVLVLFVTIISIISSIVVLTHLIVVLPVAFSRCID